MGALGGVPRVPWVPYSTRCLVGVPQPPLTPWLPQELRSALRDPSSPRRHPGARVRLNPLVLLLDAALTGELDVVQQAVAEVGRDSGDRVAGTKAGVARAGGQGDGGQSDKESNVPGAQGWQGGVGEWQWGWQRVAVWGQVCVSPAE